MVNLRESFGFVLFVGTVLLATTLTAPTEEADAILFSQSPQPELGAPLSPAYFALSPESDSPAAALSLSPLYAPENSPSPVLATGSPPELSFETSPAPEFAPVLSPFPETEPAYLESPDPSISLFFPSMAPTTTDGNDAGASHEPTPSSYSEFDQWNSNADDEVAESYRTQDGTAYSSLLDRHSKGGSGVMFRFVAAVCLVGLGGFVYLKRQENRMRKSKYDQYLELSKKEGV